MTSLNKVLEAVNSADNYYKAVDTSNCFAEELIGLIQHAAENNMFFMSKKMTGYGTWLITASLNEYRFKEYSSFLKSFRKTTHDEDYDELSFAYDVENYVREYFFEFICSQEGSEW